MVAKWLRALIRSSIVAALRKPGRGGLVVGLFAVCGLAFSVSVAWAVGELTQKPGTAGCISQGGNGGCRPGIGLDGAVSVASSPDGKSVYVASNASSAVAIFNRNPDGSLVQPPGAAGCISQGGGEGCRPGIGVDRAISVATSADGKSVYVASFNSNAVAIFNRNPDGSLVQPPGAAGCISQGGSGGCRPGIGLGAAVGVAASPDGKSVYVASAASDAVAIFNRSPDGTLEQLPGAAGCVSQGGDGGCRPGIGLDRVTSIATSADGKHVYVASFSSDAVAIFNRSPDGSLEQLPETAGCISESGSGGCRPGIGLDGAGSVVTSADGRSVYVASFSSDAVAIFNRNPDGSLEQLPGTAGCVSQGGSGGCQPGIGLDGPFGVATSADGNSVYVVTGDSDAVVIFKRNPDGTLEQLSGAAGCISQGGGGGCRPGIGLDGAGSVATSADGNSVYVASSASSAVAILDHPAPPIPPDTLAPTISGFKLAPMRFKAAPKGPSSFRFSLSESAAVEIEVDRVRSGRKIGKRCKKPTPKLAKRPRCKLFVAAGKTLRFQNRSAGSNKIAFNGTVSGRALKPGLYRASITANDAAGNSSAPKRARFTVLRPRK